MDSSTPMDRAKHPRTALAGPYGHPFHPSLITIPIGAWTASIVFDVLGLLADDARPFALGAQILIAIGVVGAVAAAVFGFLDLSVITRGTRARKVALTHMTLNLALVAVFIVDYFVRVAAGHDEVSIAGLVLSVVGLLILGVSGYLGGMLAYRYGVRVASEETQREGFR